MKRQRDEQPQWQVPYDLQLAKLYYANGNMTLADYAYNKWYSSLTPHQKTYVELSSRAQSVHWQLHFVAQRQNEQGQEPSQHTRESIARNLDKVAAIDYSQANL